MPVEPHIKQHFISFSLYHKFRKTIKGHPKQASGPSAQLPAFAISFGGHGRTGPSTQLRTGFIIMEVLIALSTIAIFSVSVAYVQALTIKWQHTAHQYLKAATIANHIIEELQINSNYIPPTDIDHMKINVIKKIPPENNVFTYITVSITWKNYGKDKSLSFYTGIV